MKPLIIDNGKQERKYSLFNINFNKHYQFVYQPTNHPYFSYNVRSSEDISSGYSSAEPVSVALSRTTSMTGATRARTKSRRAAEVSIFLVTEIQKFIVNK